MTDWHPKFWTFFQFSDSSRSTWAEIEDPHLKRSQKHLVEQSPNLTEKLCVSYWLQKSPKHILARHHLWAYLQKTCKQVAYSSYATLNQGGDFGESFSLQSCFQEAVSQIDAVLEKFSSKQGSNLEGYARTVIANSLKSKIYEHRESRLSKWGFLRRLSTKRLQEALEWHGYHSKSDTIQQYCLVLKCFKDVYTPKQFSGSRSLPDPERVDLENIASLYDREVKRLSSDKLSIDHLSPDKIKKILEECAAIVRKFLSPTTVSLNVPLKNAGGERIDYVIGQDLFESEAVLMGNSENLSELTTFLIQTLNRLDEEEKKILQLRYGLRLTTSEIARQLQKVQSTVHRKISRTLSQKLLVPLAKYTREKNLIELNSQWLTKECKPYLEEWLHNYFKNTNSQLDNS